jgi:trypsin
LGRFPQERIIHGVNAPVGRYPYTVSLQDDTFHFCGASLIAPDVVLSAAHCQDGFGFSQRNVVVNPHRLNNPIAASQTFHVQQMIVHPDYQAINEYDHDFMLIQLDGSSTLTPIRLNTKANEPASGDPLQVMGWGLTSTSFDANIANVLQEVQVQAMSNAECEAASEFYQGQVTDDMLCALESNKGSCQGDSGGPLVVLGANAQADRLVGVVSFGVGCAETERTWMLLSDVFLEQTKKTHEKFVESCFIQTQVSMRESKTNTNGFASKRATSPATLPRT